MDKAILIRLSDNGVQTIGRLIVFRLNTVVFECATLELSYKDNKKRISCIPDGKYQVVQRISEKYQHHFHIKDVPNREWILIHSGNYFNQTLGCVLVGSKHLNVNSDKEIDVINSVQTLGKLYDTTKEFELVIKSIF